MGVSIVAKDKLFTNIVKNTFLPVRTNLIGEFLTGKTADRTKVNRADGTSETITGSPTYNEWSAVFGNGGYVTTDILLPNGGGSAVTMIGVAKKPTGGAILIGNMGVFNDGANTGVNLVWGSIDGAAQDLAGMYTNSTLTAARAAIGTAALNNTSYYMIVGRLIYAGANTIQASYVQNGNLVNGTASDAGNISQTNVNLAGSQRIGHGVNNIGQYSANIDMAAGAIYNRALSDAELLQIYNYYKSYFTGRLTLG